MLMGSEWWDTDGGSVQRGQWYAFSEAAREGRRHGRRRASPPIRTLALQWHGIIAYLLPGR